MKQKTTYKRFQVVKRQLANRQASVGNLNSRFVSGTTIDVTIYA